MHLLCCVDISLQQVPQDLQYCNLQTRPDHFYIYKWSRQFVQIEWSSLGLVSGKDTNHSNEEQICIKQGIYYEYTFGRTFSIVSNQ